MTGPPGAAGGTEVDGGPAVTPHVVGTASRRSLGDALAAIFSAQKLDPKTKSDAKTVC